MAMAMLTWLRGKIEAGLARVLMRALRLTGRRAGVAVVYHAVGLRQGDPGRDWFRLRSVPDSMEAAYLRRKF